MITKKDYNKAVLLLTEDSSGVIVPNGETWEIGFWYGNANPFRDTHVMLVWDYLGTTEEILALTYTSEYRYLGRTLTGDGVKQLSIVLVNDSAGTERLGAGYEYKV